MEYAIETNKLTKKYNKCLILNNVNLHVEKGAIYGLIGKNGAGKTTLLRIICGLQKPSAGSFNLYGVSFQDKNICEVKEKMSAIVESPALLLNMTAEENLIHQFKIIGMPCLNNNYDNIYELLKLVNLKDSKNKKVKNFSLGMKQRLGIAILLASNPDLIILDEPLNGLDPEGIIEMRELILKLNKEKGLTVLISSHYLDELAKIATYYGFLDKGKIIKEISSQELKESLRKKLEIQVSNIKVAVHYLEEEKIEYEVVNNKTILLYGEPNISSIILNLSQRNCEILDIKEMNETLENYFLKIVGGQNE